MTAPTVSSGEEVALEKPLEFYSLQLENDLWGSGDDRFYTHGTELSYLRTGAPPSWLAAIADVLPFFHRTSESAVGYSVGQAIFTPSDTDSEALVSNDRPYAGWLYFSAGLASRVEMRPTSETIDGLAVTLGMVGPSAHADNVQTEFHKLIDVDVARGWDHQLKDEPGVILTYARKWRHFPLNGGPRQWEWSPHLAASVGNVYTYGAAGMMVRWGTNLRTDIGPPNIRPGFPGAPFFQPGAKSNWYLFGGIEGRAVARNIFLDGNTFRDSHSVDRKPLVADVQFGVAFHVDSVRIAISNVYRTREFKGQDEPAQYGAINITVFTD
ncbi:MAG: lipid A deacylase LpxR family protein [Chromatiales bacterium]|jgi:hypothetical protein|nr:lipid A deacylase LpxR family protein [Chromatiales bacterium]